ncbi:MULTISPECIES: thiol-disulfide oxidoreductase ResA [Pontibacillus]|uniref:Thiol-disulfide oxidoreductase ResA n=1 Tax=Pontibacillus chungwhensis TaxID=265426 RepID=A0ABY8URY7_9BACI|nr:MULTISPECIES: thiol-disulfide oxidoreductase ResA [Pontibacillus]MCD5323042.1 thiol-disulfide oxidoreductase ResA [Pontibacillus sp. HN14]WIF96435.1 thiol-disulfide oxidoreductase ResA [Pontibacillus chungwhensis]
MADKKKKRLIFRSIILVVLAIAVGFALYSSFTDGEKAVLKEGDTAPNFKLKTVNHETADALALSDFKGKGVMVNFWATYCEPCKEEMPYMEELYKKYKDKDVEILAVNLDQSELVVKRFLNEYGITFPIVHDKKGQVMGEYGVGYLPASYFINPDGTIEKKIIGPLTLDRLEGYLQDITPES